MHFLKFEFKIKQYIVAPSQVPETPLTRQCVSYLCVLICMQRFEFKQMLEVSHCSSGCSDFRDKVLKCRNTDFL